MATIKTQLLLRNDTTANWNTNSTKVLGKGEVGIEWSGTTPKIKIGDGTKSWAALPYFGGTFNITGTGNTIVDASYNSTTGTLTLTKDDRVTGSSLTAEKIVVGNGGVGVKVSNQSITTSKPISTSDNTTIPTSKAVYDAINDVLTAAVVFKGTIGEGGGATLDDLPATPTNGDMYKIITDGIYGQSMDDPTGIELKEGDVVIAREIDAEHYTWDVIPSGDDVEDTWREIRVNNAKIKGNEINGGYINFSGTNGITVAGHKTDENTILIGHTNIITAGTAGTNATTNLVYGGSFVVPKFEYDANGHLKSVTNTTLKLPAASVAYSLPVAKWNELGGVKPAYSSTGAAELSPKSPAGSTNEVPVLNPRTSTLGKWYAVESDVNGLLYVNVPWKNDNTTYGAATSDTLGLVQLGSDTVQNKGAQDVSSETGRTYAIQKDANGRLVVNVPWTDNNTDTKNTAGATNKTGKLFLVGAAAQTANPQTYSNVGVFIDANNSLQSDNGLGFGSTTPIKLTSSDARSCPIFENTADSITWQFSDASDLDNALQLRTILDTTNITSDTNATAYTLNSTSTNASRYYAVRMDAKSNQLFVNVPWTDNNTTYSAATASNLGLVKLGNGTTQSVAMNSVTSDAGCTYGIQMNSSQQLVVNVPKATTSRNGLVPTASANKVFVTKNSATSPSWESILVLDGGNAGTTDWGKIS